jgi:hypothetical protein
MTASSVFDVFINVTLLYSLERIDTLQNLLYLIKPSVKAGGFFYIFAAWKRTSNIWD